jgi:hypothetical protein
MNKGGQSTLFILGIAGMGLSIAMFFDSMKPVKAAQVEEPLPNTLPIEATPVEQIVPETLPPTDKVTRETKDTEQNAQDASSANSEAIQDNVDNDSNAVPGEKELVISEPLETINEDPLAPTQSGNGSESSSSQIDYREYYKLRKQEDDIKRSIEAGDNSYTGDGSAWSKRMYFIKEAYRRSREATPVDPVILNRVKYTKGVHKSKK